MAKILGGEMAQYTIQVSNDSDAGRRIPTEQGERSWETRYHGPIATPEEARQAVDEFAHFYKNVRAFKGSSSKMFYAVLRMR